MKYSNIYWWKAELLLTAVPHVIRLGRQESKKLLVMLYECLLERIWGLEDKTTNKQLEIQLRAVLDIDGPLVECAGYYYPFDNAVRCVNLLTIDTVTIIQ